MSAPSEREAAAQVVAIISEFLEIEKLEIDVHPADWGGDFVVEAGGYRFLVEYKSSGSAAPVAGGLKQLRAATLAGRRAIPLLAVPYMGQAGRERCQQAGVGWLDLSGNAHIVAPGLRIIVDGRPNRFKRRGRPGTAFSPKASRVARWLLICAGQFLSQRDIARATGMDEGYTSRIVRRLEANDLIERNASNEIRARDPNLLLDAWSESYEFDKHEVLRVHVAARSGEGVLHQLHRTFYERGAAVTGLSAAWLMTHFAAFRLVTIYLPRAPDPAIFTELEFREVERGANLWIVIPNDEGVFQGRAHWEGIPCVHPVQVYLDLVAHPERSDEAARALRSRQLTWGRSA